MKNNTHKAKELLQQAIRAMPQDFAMTEARSFLYAALRKIEQVEKKRAKRDIVEKEQAQQIWADPQWAIKYIDNMIKEENKKLQEIEEKKKKPENDENVQTVFG